MTADVLKETNSRNKIQTAYPPVKIPKIFLGLAALSVLAGYFSVRRFATVVTNDITAQNELQNLVPEAGSYPAWQRDDAEFIQSLSPFNTLREDLATANTQSLKLEFLSDQEHQSSSEESKSIWAEKIKYACYALENESISFGYGIVPKIGKISGVPVHDSRSRWPGRGWLFVPETSFKYLPFHSDEGRATEAQAKFTRRFEWKHFNRENFINRACSPDTYDSALKTLKLVDGYLEKSYTPSYNDEFNDEIYPSYGILDNYRMAAEFPVKDVRFVFGWLPFKYHYTRTITNTIDKYNNNLHGDGFRLSLKCGENNYSSDFVISNNGLYTQNTTEEHWNEETFTITRNFTTTHGSRILMSYYLDGLCDIIAASEKDPEIYLNGVNKNQYILTKTGIWYFDNSTKLLNKLEFLPNKSPEALFREFSSKIDERRSARKGDLDLITSFTGHTPTHVRESRQILVPVDVTQEAAQRHIANDVTEFIKDFIAALELASSTYDVKIPKNFLDFSPSLKNKSLEINKNLIKESQNIYSLLFQNIVLLAIAAGAGIMQLSSNLQPKSQNSQFFKQGPNEENKGSRI